MTTFNVRWFRDERQEGRVALVCRYCTGLDEWLEPFAPFLDEILILHDAPLKSNYRKFLEDLGATFVFEKLDEDEQGLEYLNRGLGTQSAGWTLHLRPFETMQGIESLESTLETLNQQKASAGILQVFHNETQGFVKPEIRLFKRREYRFGKNAVIPAFKAVSFPSCEVDNIHIKTSKALPIQAPLVHIAQASRSTTEKAYIELIKASIALLEKPSEHHAHTAIYLLEQAKTLNSLRPEAYNQLYKAFTLLNQKQKAKQALAQVKPLFAKNWEAEWIHLLPHTS
jgi:hypothetical protein